MTELEKAIAIISAASGAEAPAVAERLKSDDAATDIATEIFEPKYKAQRDQGDQRATMKTRKEVEKAFKAAGVEDASFADLTAAIETLKGQGVAASAKELTDEQALKLPAVVKALNTLKQSQDQAIEAARNEERQKLAEKEQAFTKAQTDAKVRQEAERLVSELNPNFSADPARAAKQRQKLVEDLIAQGGYQLNQTGGIDLVDADGNLLDGTMGNPAKFADRVRTYADELYGLPTSTAKSSPGLTPADAASAAVTAYAGPKTQEEVDSALLNLNTREERVALNEAWDKYQKETKS